MSTKRTKSSAKQSKAASKPGVARVTVLGYSATSLLKWMGKNGWSSDAAAKAVSKLAKGGEVQPATIATALSDGRNPKYNGNAAPVTAAEAKQLKAAAK